MASLTPKSILARKHWIFDMDGTLTVAKHDFDGIRRELGLPEDLPILESIERLPADEAAAINQRLDEIELAVAERSEPAAGAAELLEYLLKQGTKIAILTRNNAINIEVTLKAAGLHEYFTKENLLSRECTAPKPAPDGIYQLLDNWQSHSTDAVMIGDSIHDLDAGRNAKAATIYYDPNGLFTHKAQADLCIKHLSELMQ